MAAGRQSTAAIREWLVRLGRLCFNDFLLLAPETLGFGHRAAFAPELTSDWAVALNNAPHIQRHFQWQTAGCGFHEPPAADRQPSIEDIHAAQERLVAHFAYDLLRAKAPPLYDALPWHDWDFSIVTRRFPLWKTRFLLAGDGMTVAMCRCRKSAGVYALEPCETIARYIQRKAEAEKVRRFRLLSLSPQATSREPLSEIPLPESSVDLAVIGSISSLDTGTWKPAIRELLRVSRNVLLVENYPLAPALDRESLRPDGFESGTVEVRSLGVRPCHWRLRAR